MKIRESEEMYLETILLLSKKMPIVHSINIVDELSYAKSSVSRAVNLLKKKKYIDINDASEITLTKDGLKRANDIYERHCVITKVLMALGAEENEAEENACRIEHVISKSMLQTFKDFIEKQKK